LTALEKRDATGVQRALDVHLDHFVAKVTQQPLEVYFATFEKR